MLCATWRLLGGILHLSTVKYGICWRTVIAKPIERPRSTATKITRFGPIIHIKNLHCLIAISSHCGLNHNGTSGN